MYAPGPPLPSGMRPGFCFSGSRRPASPCRSAQGAVTGLAHTALHPRRLSSPSAGRGSSSPDDVAGRSRRWTATTPHGRPRAGPDRAGPVRVHRRATRRTVRTRRGPRASGRCHHGSATRQGAAAPGSIPRSRRPRSRPRNLPSSSSSSMVPHSVPQPACSVPRSTPGRERPPDPGGDQGRQRFRRPKPAATGSVPPGCRAARARRRWPGSPDHCRSPRGPRDHTAARRRCGQQDRADTHRT